MRKAINLTQQNVVEGVLQKPQDGDSNTSDWMLSAIELFKAGKYKEARTMIVSAKQDLKSMKKFTSLCIVT